MLPSEPEQTATGWEHTPGKFDFQYRYFSGTMECHHFSDTEEKLNKKRTEEILVLQRVAETECINKLKCLIAFLSTLLPDFLDDVRLVPEMK